jgi:hypothetical protein
VSAFRNRPSGPIGTPRQGFIFAGSQTRHSSELMAGVAPLQQGLRDREAGSKDAPHLFLLIYCPVSEPPCRRPLLPQAGACPTHASFFNLRSRRGTGRESPVFCFCSP